MIHPELRGMALFMRENGALVVLVEYLSWCRLVFRALSRLSLN